MTSLSIREKYPGNARRGRIRRKIDRDAASEWHERGLNARQLRKTSAFQRVKTRDRISISSIIDNFQFDTTPHTLTPKNSYENIPLESFPNETEKLNIRHAM